MFRQVLCGDSSSSVRVFNVSTGKVDPQSSCPLLGHSLCAELGQRGAVLWVGNERGHVESVRVVEHSAGRATRLHKGCRLTIGGGRVTSLSFRAAPRSQDRPWLLVAMDGADILRLFSVLDDLGSLEPMADVGAGMAGNKLLAASFAPLLCASATACAAAGAQDGSVLLLDLQRRTSEEASSSSSSSSSSCVANKLMAHSKPVIALTFSHGEDFLATADASGQIIIWKK